MRAIKPRRRANSPVERRAGQGVPLRDLGRRQQSANLREGLAPTATVSVGRFVARTGLNAIASRPLTAILTQYTPLHP